MVWLSTTSLFAHGSSQYERLRLPAGVISRDQSEIRFDYIGDTAGYGTIQFADETVRSLERVLRIRRGYRDVNGVFGEGASPRRRKLRLGLDAVGIQADVTMLHHQKRRIYAIPLFKDAAAYLCGLTPDVPDYLAKPEIYCDASERIIEFWRSRWLSSRLTHDKSWQTLGSTRKWTLSSMLPDSSPVKSNSHGEPDMRAMKSHREQRSGSGNSGAGDGRERLSFWRRLAAAGSNSVSEGLSDEEFKSLHLKTGLEDYLVQRANETTSIVLTGNAGDGKTHLARVLRERLGDAAKRFDFIFDATAMMTKEDEVDPIIERWHRAQESGAGIVLAINHYPLHMLRRKIAGELPAISEDLDRQWRQRLVVDGDRSESEDSSILLVDLSLRNVLQRDFAKRVFEKILNDSAVEEYANSEHDINFSFNYQHLKHPEVQERLLMLLNRLISSGIRASVRELWILASRLLFGVDGEDTAQGALEAWYSERLFEEDSRFPLVAAMCTIADPSKVSHLHVDSYIENRKAWKSRDWLVDDEIPDGLPLSALTVSPKNIEENQRRFPALKRRYYFEHQHGGKRVFELDRSADARFHTILNDRGNDLEYLGELIEGINRCYFPQQFEGIREKLCLWVGHRLDEQPTKSFVASEYIPRERLEILRPCPPRSIQKALQYSPDHIVLRVSGEPESDQSNNETLRIDATLFRTLISVAEGMPRHLINAGEMNRLDAFIDHLKQLRPPSLLEILIYNSEQALASSIKVSSDLRRYLDIHPV